MMEPEAVAAGPKSPRDLARHLARLGDPRAYTPESGERFARQVRATRRLKSEPKRHILCAPAESLARYVRQNTDKTVIAWDGNCYVHHQITPAEILAVKEKLPHVKVLVHPECRADVLALADAVMSTSGMVRYAAESPAAEFLVVTECGLSDRLTLELPEKRFYKACKLCRYMKMITLADTRAALDLMRHEIVLDEEVRRRAARALTRMFELSQ